MTEPKQWSVLGAIGGKVSVSFFPTEAQALVVFKRWREANPTASVFLMAVLDGWVDAAQATDKEKLN